MHWEDPEGWDGEGVWEGASGWGAHVNPWLIHVNVWEKPLQYCKVISLQLIKINEKKIGMCILKISIKILKIKLYFKCTRRGDCIHLWWV